MTTPWLMNCKHKDEGWCLDCTKDLGERYTAVRNSFKEPINILFALLELKLYKDKVGKDDYYKRERASTWLKTMAYLQRREPDRYKVMEMYVNGIEGPTTGLEK